MSYCTLPAVVACRYYRSVRHVVPDRGLCSYCCMFRVVVAILSLGLRNPPTIFCLPWQILSGVA